MSGLTAVFSYGSNSREQLRGRLEAFDLTTRPAVLLDVEGVPKPKDAWWIRTFSGKSKNWDNGGVADIVAVSKAKLSHSPEPVYGCVAMLSEKQISLLDIFEGVPRVYNRYRAVCLVGDRKDKVEAIVYLRVKKRQFRMPAESYKCAVLHNIQQHHPSSGTLPILTGSGGLVEIWSRPPPINLTLSGLLFSVGIGLANPPVMPYAVNEWKEVLASKMNIRSTGQLAKALGALKDEEVLRQVHPALDLALLSALRRTLGVSAPDQAPTTAATAATSTPNSTDRRPPAYPTTSPVATALPAQFVSHSMGQHPVVITVPHGGYRRPATVANRRKTPKAIFCSDHLTMEMSVALEQQLKQLSGARATTPHVIRLHMHRTKLDGNRSLDDACDADSPFARDVWTEYHRAIQTSVDACVRKFGCCLVFDLHGQNYRKELELGYGVSMSELVQIHTSFKSGARHHQSSSVQALAARSAVSLGQVIFGPNSFGALLSAHSKGSSKAFPSPSSPPPGVVDRLSVSAFTTRRYGVGQPGVAAIQLEVPWAPRSGKDVLMQKYVTHLANAIADFRYTWLQC